jgi:benzoyl-CoA reductase/2-hydroxyglutaryl-CoA dehydratase subunit BcrC/BadD/HgdB
MPDKSSYIVSNLVNLFEKRIEYRKAKEPRKSKLYYDELMANYYKKLRDVKDSGWHLAWVSYAIPSELFYSMDILPFVPEQFAVTVLGQSMGQGEGFEYFDIGVGTGYSRVSCSSHILSLGMAKADVLPPPDLMVVGTIPCDAALVGFEALDHIYKCPIFRVDFPYLGGDLAIQRLVKELEELVSFLEENTGKKLDYDRLKDTLKHSQRSIDYFCRINELRMARPGPLGVREFYTCFIARIYTDGLPDSIRFFQAKYEEVKEMVEKGKGVIPEEKHRLIWWGPAPFHSIQLFDWMAEEYQAVVVADPFNLVKRRRLPDPSDPLACLAKKMLDFPIWKISSFYDGYRDEILREIQRVKDETGLDGAIFFAPFGCRQTSALQRIVRDDLLSLGLPTLTLDGDVTDPRISSFEQMKIPLREFLKIL